MGPVAEAPQPLRLYVSSARGSVSRLRRDGAGGDDEGAHEVDVLLLDVLRHLQHARTAAQSSAEHRDRNGTSLFGTLLMNTLLPITGISSLRRHGGFGVSGCTFS